MKAIVRRRYGAPDVLELIDIKKPEVKENGVLVRVLAASANPLDWRLMRGEPYIMRMDSGVRAPKNIRMGVDMAGIVEAVGSNITMFKPGDQVFGSCRGAFAEYVPARETSLAIKPANITFEEAAAIPVAGLTALQGLRDKGQLRAGQKVLINGAAGGVGTFAVQIAKVFGAEVTGVCSTRNLEMVRSLGADCVIDYTREDFTKSGQSYDLLFDCVGNRSVLACRRIITPTGTYIAAGGPKGRFIGALMPMIQSSLVSRFVSQKMLPFMSATNQTDLIQLKELIESGKVRPVIDRSYTLEEVPEAIRYLEAGHARGKVIIKVADE